MTPLTPKRCPYKRIFGDFNGQPIPSDYYKFLNDDDDDGNNIPGTPVDDYLPYNKVVKYAVVTNDEVINDEIIIYDDDSLASDIKPLQHQILEI